MDLPPSEPVAIVGMSALYPRARGVEAFWDLVTAPRLRCACTDPPAGEDPAGRPAVPHGLLDIEIDVAAFKIPPAQSASMTRMQKLMLEASRQAMSDAGLADRPVRGERFDVIVGVCAGLDRQYLNALRVEAQRLARDLRSAGQDGRDPDIDPDIGPAAGAAAAELLELLEPRLAGSPHDRVGEMASTIPARIASVFKLRGRTLALEAADGTSLVALAHAVGSLRRGDSDTVLVVAGQLRESGLLAGALDAKGLTSACGHPFAGPGEGFTLAEGVSAVLLKRLSDVAEDDRVHAVIRGCALGQDPRPGTFRYSVSVEHRREVAELAYRDADVPADSIGLVECFGSGFRAETQAELTALSGLYTGSPTKAVLGSVRDRLGHTFANAGLASVIKAALALHRGTLPPVWSPAGALPAPGSAFRFLASAQRWERSASPRRAAVSGASLTGMLAHFVLEEHQAVPVPPERRPVRRPVRVREGEPVAVISWGAHFAGATGPAAVWDVFRSGRDRIGPLPTRILDREIYFDPSALSLTHTYT
ncbi:polyketide synthase, partial [Catenulispora pinisilvae]|uniref:beta-ketoacyl [acyl carrier protein] synthase domain-containing protein n=1 Tax=Catenulispora pinisilvae TaxID=2705253 RepID=UPI002263F1E3